MREAAEDSIGHSLLLHYVAANKLVRSVLSSLEYATPIIIGAYSPEFMGVAYSLEYATPINSIIRWA